MNRTIALAVLLIGMAVGLCVVSAATLTCTVEEHTHNDGCYGLICGKDEHTHSDECYGLICGKEEHTHKGVVMANGVLKMDGKNYNANNYKNQIIGCFKSIKFCGHAYKWDLVCDKTEHTHSDECKGLICDKTEHTHNETCYTEDPVDPQDPQDPVVEDPQVAGGNEEIVTSEVTSENATEGTVPMQKTGGIPTGLIVGIVTLATGVASAKFKGMI